MRRLVIPVALLIILGLAGISQAEQMTNSIPRWSVGSGGIAAGGDYHLSSIASQPIAGSQSGGDYHLKWGFWHPVDHTGTIYLPIIALSDTTPP